MQNRPLLHDKILICTQTIQENPDMHSNNSKYIKTVVLEKMHLKPCDDNDNDNDLFVQFLQ